MREKLKQLRLEKGKTQGDVASYLKVTRSCYANYEQGTRDLRFSRVIALKEYFGVDDDEFFLNTEDTKGINKKNASV